MLACSPTWQDAPFADETWEIWAHCSGQSFYGDRRVNLWWDLHDVDTWRQGKVWYKSRAGDPPVYVDWLASRSVPVVMQRHYPLIPTSTAYPLREIVEHFNIVPAEWGLTPADPRWWGYVKDRGEFSSTFTYMMAAALYQGATEIAMYGVDFIEYRKGCIDYLYQRPGAKYWVGLARGMGVPVTVARGSWFETGQWVYGYQPRPEELKKETVLCL